MERLARYPSVIGAERFGGCADIILPDACAVPSGVRYDDEALLLFSSTLFSF